ncbi:SPW repeat protein [Mycolicibacterium sp. XJ662]
MRNSARVWVSGLALAVGVAAVVASFVVTETRVGAGLTFGFGAFIAFFALLSLLVHNRAPDFFGLLVVGVATFILPFLGQGFVSDRGAAWTAWVAGFLAMTLGGLGWLRSTPPHGLVGGGQAVDSVVRHPLSNWIGRAALLAGLVTAVLGATVLRASAVGVIVTIGLGAMTAVIAVWVLAAEDAPRDYLTLAVVGFALFLSPWVAGFTGEAAGWTAWIAGAVVTALGVGGYLSTESAIADRAGRGNVEAR